MVTLGGIAALAAVLAVPVGVILLTRWRRTIEDVVTTGSAQGQTGLATHPTDLIVETTRSAAPVHHMLPLLGHRCNEPVSSCSIRRSAENPAPHPFCRATGHD